MKRSPSNSPLNISERLYGHAKNRPTARALSLNGGRSLTFQEYWAAVDRARLELRRADFNFGSRVIVMNRADQDFMILITALFAEGITPVVLDPRLAKDKWRNALELSRTTKMIATPAVYHFQSLFSKFRGFNISNIRHFTRSTASIPSTPLAPIPTDAGHINLVTLTSGTTGQPKLIERTFEVLLRQQTLATRYLPELTKDRHLTVYALAALQSLVDGADTFYLTSFNAKRILRNLEKHRITRFSGPPSVLDALLEQMQKTGKTLPALQCILIGGAPVPRRLQEKCKRIFPHTKLWIVYGSTECEPISLTELLPADQTPGYLVGPAVAELQLIKKNPFKLHGHEFFEVALKGENLVANSNETALETGDLARLDEKGNLWLVGRVNEMVRGIPVAFLEEPVERFANVKRAAAVEKNGKTAIFVEMRDKSPLDAATKAAIDRHFQELNLREIEVRSIHTIPVDLRHRWKVQREPLRDLL